MEGMDMSPDHSMESSSSTAMMQMSFYWGKRATILFEGWRTTSVGSYIGSLLALLLISFLYQYLERLTSSSSPLLCSAGSQSSTKHPQSGDSSHLPLSIKLLLTLLFCIRVGLAYLLMLAVMSFNAGVFLAVVLGFSAGFFVFRTDIHAPKVSPVVADSSGHA